MGTAISQVMETQVKSYLTGNLEPFLDLFADDAVIIPSTATKPIQNSKSVRRWIKTNAQVPKYTMKVIKFEEAEDMAYQLIKYSGKNTNRAGVAAEFSGHVLRVLRRQNDGWKVVCAMWKDEV